MLVIAKQKPRAWLVWMGGVVVIGAAIFVGWDEGIGSGALVLFIGAAPLAAYWYFRIRPWEEDPEVFAETLRTVAGAVARRGRVSPEDARRMKEAEERARRHWEAGQGKPPDSPTR